MIGPFRGEYRFLSNFYPAEVVYYGIVFPTTEHAYQAMKAEDLGLRKRIAELPTPGAAKRYAKKIGIRPGWEEVRVRIMDDLLREKFKHPDLREKLLATGDEELIEVNTWGDTFWGVCDETGENRLGKLLMQVRAEIRAKTPNERGFFVRRHREENPSTRKEET